MKEPAAGAVLGPGTATAGTAAALVPPAGVAGKRHLISAVGRYAIAVTGQASLSVFNFALNVLLVRTLVPQDYGSFALCLVFATLATSISGALACSPLIVFGTAREGRPSRRAVEVLLSTVNAGIVLLVLVAAGPLLFLLIGQPPLVCAAGALFIAGFTARLYTRTFCYARHRPRVALAGDLASISLAALVLLIAARFGSGLSLTVVFLALAAGNFAAMLLEAARLRLGSRLVIRPSSLRRYPGIWRQVRWSLVGSTTTLVQAQAHSFLVTAAYGPAALAPLAAGQVIFGPVRIMMTAWHAVMQPDVVLAIGRKDRRTVMRTLVASAGGLALVVLALGAAIALFWEPLFTLLYAERYAHMPMGWIVAGWCAVTLCTALACAPSGILQTFRQFRPLAFATVYGGLLSLGAAAVLLFTSGPLFTIIGALLGEALMAILLLRLSLRTASAMPTTARAGTARGGADAG